MSTSDPKSSRDRGGSAHLERLSSLRKRIREEAIVARVLVVEDQKQDAHFIETPLRRLFGDGLRLDTAATVRAMAEALKSQKYDIVLLDDQMDADQRVEATLPLIRLHMPKVPVVVVSHLLTRVRRAELQRLGITALHAKDDLDSAMLGEAILDAVTGG